MKKKRCYCPSERRYIDPHSSSCIDKMIHSFEKLNRPTKNQNCGSDNSEPPGVFEGGPDDIEESLLCSHPAQYICDPPLNPNMAIEEKNHRLYDQLIDNSEKDPSVQNYISSKIKNKNGHCYQLRDPFYKKCVQLRNNVLSRKLYTDERKAKAQSLFEKAKAAIVTVLNKREKALRELGIEDTRQLVENMKKAVQKLTLDFGTQNLDLKEDYIAFFNFNFNKNSSRVFLGGMIVQVDNSPESLVTTLLHEISHQVSIYLPGIGMPSNIKSPFDKELACLRRKDSAEARSGDFECIDRLSHKYESSNPQLALVLSEIAKVTRLYPNHAWGLPVLPSTDEICQQGQLNEVSADWLATEGGVELTRSTPIDSTTGVRLIKGKRYINFKQRMNLYPHILKKMAWLCDLYHFDLSDGQSEISIKAPHPLHEDRLNGIFLAHPLIKMELGCSADTVHNLRDLNQPPITSGKVYCGMHLYLPSKGVAQ